MSPPQANFVRLSTDFFPARDRIEAAREVFGRAIMKIEFEPLPDAPFQLDMVFRSLPDFGMASGTRSAMTCLRTSELIDSDDLILAVSRSGSGLFHFHGRETHISGSAATVLRSSDAGHLNVHSTSEFVSFRFSLSRIMPLIGDLDSKLLRPISADIEALRLLVHYSDVLRDETALETPELQSLVVSHLHDLAAMAIGATRDATVAAESGGIPAARLRAIKADIVKNLTDRQLSIEMIAVRHGISSRYVSMLFDGDATTFSEFVIGQRLLRAHQMLIDPRLAGRAISVIAFDSGFGDLSYFNRAFRRRYGATPSDVRAKAQE